MTTPDIAGLCERLRKRTTASFEANKNFGRKGKEWAIDTEVEWQAADTLERQAAEIRAVVAGMAQMVAEDVANRAIIERQAAEIERLRGALWPFAQVKPTAAKGFVNICALNVDVIEARAAHTGEDT
jgi:hypothetical protein